LTLWLGATAALAQQPAPSLFSPQPIGQQPARADAGLDAAKRAYEALPMPERQAIQDALVWTGDLNGTPDGTFGPRTYEAIRAYQTRAKLNPNGILDPAGRTGLIRAAEQARSAAGFKIVADAATGIAIGIPERTLPKRDANPRGGSRWQSADGKITLDTRAMPPGEAELPALYERNLAIQTPGRQVTYKLLRPDFYVIAGETAGGKFYTRYASGPDGIRGFSIGYDKTVSPDFERQVVAIANSFVAFTSAAPPAAVAAAPAAPPAPRPTPAPPRPAKPVLVATGLVLAPGQAVTGRAVDGCPDLRVAGAKAQIAQSDPSGLRLLTFQGPTKPAALLRRTNAPDAEVSAVAMTIAASFGPAAPVAASGAIGTDGRLNAALQGGVSGAAVFDRGGAFVGLITSPPAAPRQVAGLVPPMAYEIVGAGDVGRLAGRDFGAASGPDDQSAADLAAAVSDALVAVECVK
jgi:peptidoglycan hydrolase-like protein with peptidoglycan-binding domain